MARERGKTPDGTGSGVQAVLPPDRVEAPAGESRHERIARRAYDRFTARGRAHGHDLDDWLEAERDLAEPAARSGLVKKRSASRTPRKRASRQKPVAD